MPPISTLYLVPHAHTDIGYTHDPAIAWELHDHFLDRAIDLCEATAQAPRFERFCWTVEVFSTLEHWWARRDDRQRERLLALIRAGRIDLGRRYTDGTFLNSPLNIQWETDRAAAFCARHGLDCPTVFQNDVNGMSIRYARELAARGVSGFAMGLNTTMGLSPQPRPGAFWWNLGGGSRLLVWNGWIYNRMGRWVHLNELGTKLDSVWDDLCARLPEGYPFPFMMMSGTIGDNVGPFVHLPEQVARFNARKLGLEVRLVTVTQFMEAVRATPGLPELAGDWNDAWTFGSGSMPQEVAALRRAHRRLEVIDATLALAAPEVATPHVRELVERANHEASIAAEHTYCSHTAELEATHGDDGRRQWVESQVCFHHAVSFSSLALRELLVGLAARFPVDRPSALLVNPTPKPLPMRLLWNRRAVTHLATTEVLEHLTQLDREPTLDWVHSAAEIGIPEICLPPHSLQVVPLRELPPAEAHEDGGLEIGDPGALAVRVQADGSLAAVSREGEPWIEAPSGLPVEEHPLPSLKFKSEAEKRDPSDAEWNPELHFERIPSGTASRITRKTSRWSQELVIAREGSPLQTVRYKIDPLMPGILEMELELRLDDVSTPRAFLLPFHFRLPGSAPVRFLYDSCGDWTEAVAGQLPGSGTSFYESYRGVAAEREGRCVYMIAPDAPLWQFGGFTYGHPHAEIDRSRATLVSWLYNNYWYTNFPSVTPGRYRLRYLLAFDSAPFDPERAGQLYAQFSTPFLSHPVWPAVK